MYRLSLAIPLICARSGHAFDEAFKPARARSQVQRLEFCHTPKHGSWLSIAETELSSMTRQYVTGRRFATFEELSTQTTAWHQHSYSRQRTVDWQFKVDDASQTEVDLP
jgi:hypothetical protein